MQIPVNKDLRDYKVSEVGNFSLKEAVFIGAAGITAYLMYFVESQLLNGEVYLPSCMIPAAIILAFGFLKPGKMSLLHYLQTVFVEKNLMPKILIWESEYLADINDNERLFGEEYKPDKKYLDTINSLIEPTPQKGKKKKNEKKK